MLGMGLKKKRPYRVFDFGKIVRGKQMSNEE
jgi:hypothetical protein